MWTPSMGREEGWDKTSNAGRVMTQGIKETKQRNRIMNQEEEEKKAQTGARGCMGLISFGIGCYAIYLFIHAMGWI